MLRSRLAIAAAAVMGLGSLGGARAVDLPRDDYSSQRPFAIPASSLTWRGTRGAGISMAQQKRAAKKARNVAKHKARVRG